MSNPIINSVLVDSGVTQITVSGSGFEPSASAPLVRFDGTTLTVVTFSDTQFVATLPGGVTSGTYLLEVENSDSFTNTTDFEVAVDASGTVAASEGFIGMGGGFWGSANNIPATGSPYYIPLLGALGGSGDIYDTQLVSTGVGDLSINLGSPLPAGASSLIANIKNITTGNFLGNVTISAGGSSARSGGSSLVINSGDQVMLYVYVTGSATLIPYFEWHS